MKAVLQPWQLLLVILAGWINRRQLAAIEYLLAENRVLMEKLGNPNIERFMRSVKEECLDRMIFFGERAVQTALADFLGVSVAKSLSPRDSCTWNRKITGKLKC